MLRSRWIMLALLFWIRLAMGFQFQSVASIATPLAQVLGFSAAAIGALIGLYIFPGFLAALPGGAVAARLPDRLSASLGLAVMALGAAVMAMAPSYGVLAAGRLGAGIGYALFTLVITKMVAEWFEGREMLTAMGVMLAAWPCGIASGLAIQPALAEAQGWPAAQWAVAALCLVDAALAALLYRAPAARRPGQATARSWPDRREAALVLLASLAWGGLNIGLIVFFSFAPRLLESQGFTTTAASGLVGIGLWVSTAAVLVGGALAERLRHPMLAAALWTAMGGIALLLLTAGQAPAWLSAAIGLSIGIPAAVMIALPAQLVRPDRLAISLGIFYAAYFAQMTVAPLIAGAAADWVGSPVGAIWVGGAAFLAGAAIIAGFPRSRRA